MFFGPIITDLVQGLTVSYQLLRC